jgi:hypothetical protein
LGELRQSSARNLSIALVALAFVFGVGRQAYDLARTKDVEFSPIYAPKKYLGHGILALTLRLAIAPAFGGILIYRALLTASPFLATSQPKADSFPNLESPAFGAEN